MRHAITAALAMLATACGIQGSGVPAEEVRPVAALNTVVNESAILVEVEARPGATDALVVECDDNLIEHIRTRVVEGRLVVDQEDGSWLAPRTECRVAVVVDRLEAIEAAGSGDLVVRSETDVGALASVRSAGSGDIRIEAPVTAPALELTSDGSGHIALESFEGEGVVALVAASGSIRVDDGQGAQAEATIEGSGDIDLSQVEVSEGHAHIAGSGSIQLRATDRVDVTIAGSGSVVVYGDPAEREEESAGSGSIAYR